MSRQHSQARPARSRVARPLSRLALRHSLRRPLQSGLLLLGIALGVAVVVAIDLANRSALAAFERSTEVVTGRATHRIVRPGGDLDEALYTQLRRQPDMPLSAPAIEGWVRVPEIGPAALRLLGVDPFAEPPFRSFLGAEGQGLPDDLLGPLLSRPRGVLIGEELAARAGLEAGDPIMLEVAQRPVEAQVVGLLAPADALSRRSLETMILADLASAQEILGRSGRLDRIDLRLTEADPPAPLMALLEPSLELLPSDEARQSAAAMTESFRLNLRALSLLALLVGMFLIWGTVRFSVVQRRRSLATLRALGVTRTELFWAVLLEAGLLGALGALAGLGLGMLLGRGALGLVAQTISDLYEQVSVQRVEPDPIILAGGFALGLAASLAAAALPAWEAARIPPVTALRRSDQESRSQEGAPRLLRLSLLAAAIGAGLLAWPGGGVSLGFLGLTAMALAFSLAVPVLTLLILRLLGPLSQRVFGLSGRLAPRGVARSLSRSAVAIAALTIAVSASIGVSVMVGSFRGTVQDWLGETLRADIFISPPLESTNRVTRRLEPALLEQLGDRPGVARALSAHIVVLREAAIGQVRAAVLLDDLAGGARRYLESQGSAEEVWEAVQGGAVVVSEPLARRHDLSLGQVLSLDSDDGPRDFNIVGIFYDYGSEQGVLYMADAVYRQHWRDESITNIALILEPGIDPEAYVRELRDDPLIAGGPPVDVRSNRGLRREVFEVFDRTFAITRALQLLAVVVAFIGVLSTLAALQLERGREFGTLRATGLTGRQLTGLSLLETGLMGAVAGLLSWPAGLGLAGVLIYVINRRAFGWTIRPELDPMALLGALLLAIGAALLAGLLPAWRLQRLPIARVLREE